MTRRPGAYTWLAACLFLIVLPLAPGLGSDFARSLLTQMQIAAIFALSYQLLLGQTGLLSFGHAVYFGLGGYAAIHLLRAVNGGLALPVPLVPLGGALAGLAFGIVFGALTTRRAGTIFALISLGVGELVHAASLMLPAFFGGEEGVTASRTRAPHLFGLDFGSQLQVYYVSAFWLLAAVLALRAFLRTPVGRLCNAVRDNPERVEFIGYDPQAIRFIAFSVAATLAGLAGGLHAVNYEIVAAESVSATRSGVVLLMVYVGGVRHLAGAILGAVVITWLQVSLSDYTSAWLLYLGLFFMAVVLYMPGGLAGLAAMHAPLLRARRFAPILRAYAAMLPATLVAALGFVALIEMAYRRSTQPESGTRMRLLGVSLETASAWPWLGAGLVAAAGIVLLRWAWPRARAAWGDAIDGARPGEAR
jgi:branched-chain amino acid transport system permease protein